MGSLFLKFESSAELCLSLEPFSNDETLLEHLLNVATRAVMSVGTLAPWRPIAEDGRRSFVLELFYTVASLPPSTPLPRGGGARGCSWNPSQHPEGVLRG
jgi:hypothetical protein